MYPHYVTTRNESYLYISSLVATPNFNNYTHYVQFVSQNWRPLYNICSICFPNIILITLNIKNDKYSLNLS